LNPQERKIHRRVRQAEFTAEAAKISSGALLSSLSRTRKYQLNGVT
jgi:hypothetical protein